MKPEELREEYNKRTGKFVGRIENDSFDGDYVRWLENKVKDYKESLLLAGRLAVGAERILNSNVYTLSRSVELLYNALMRYNAKIFEMHDKQKQQI